MTRPITATSYLERAGGPAPLPRRLGRHPVPAPGIHRAAGFGLLCLTAAAGCAAPGPSEQEAVPPCPIASPFVSTSGRLMRGPNPDPSEQPPTCAEGWSRETYVRDNQEWGEYAFAPHTGFDFRADTPGAPVHAMTSGFVGVSQDEPSSVREGCSLPGVSPGPIVIVVSPGSPHVVARYGHMGSVSVSTDQVVEVGDVLGTQGSAGCAWFEHVHVEFEVVSRDTPLQLIDPRTTTWFQERFPTNVRDPQACRDLTTPASLPELANLLREDAERLRARLASEAAEGG